MIARSVGLPTVCEKVVCAVPDSVLLAVSTGVVVVTATVLVTRVPSVMVTGTRTLMRKPNQVPGAMSPALQVTRPAA